MSKFLIVSEYAGNIGDAKDAEAREKEQNHILQLVDKFWTSSRTVIFYSRGETSSECRGKTNFEDVQRFSKWASWENLSSWFATRKMLTLACSAVEMLECWEILVLACVFHVNSFDIGKHYTIHVWVCTVDFMWGIGGLAIYCSWSTSCNTTHTVVPLFHFL